MSKVLISFLGTGRPEERHYKKAKYHFADGTEIESPFVAHALRSYYHIDRLILVGTVKSMWEEVYYSFAGDNLDDNYWELLSAHCQNSSFKSPLSLPDIAKLEQSLGTGSKAVLIYYGLNEEEILHNGEIILGLEQYLDKGDELYVDITHSFRSLPMFLMNTLIYLQNVSPKHIAVRHITYGMLDVSRELGYTPVVELNSIMQMNRWITGAYSFQEYGNAYQISDLIKDVSQRNRLVKFSDLMNLNHLAGIEKQSQELAALKNQSYDSTLSEILVKPIVNEFVKTFTTKTHCEFQLKLAQWHLRHKNYSSSYMALTESIVTYVCELNHLDWGDFENRQKVKDALGRHCSEPQNKQYVQNVSDDIISAYQDVNKYRNSIAHTIPTKWNYKQMISRLNDYISLLEQYLSV